MTARQRYQALSKAATESSERLRKDQSLDILARHGNVAQFVSFAPGAQGKLVQQYARLAGLKPNHRFETAEEAITRLLGQSSEGTINIRSFSEESPQSQEFVYGIAKAEEAVAIARRIAAKGLFTIANETIDIADGGVSGVAQAQIIEFAPDDTPRCVEKPGVASLPRAVGMSILAKVYGFKPELGANEDTRVEFSIHPKPRGWRAEHTITWEYDQAPGVSPTPTFTWPNRFSRHIGDKAFGLLVAEELGLPVPRTTVFGRRVAPFSFGSRTGSAETWLRTAPVEPEPGKYTTRKGWTDPFALMASEDPAGSSIVSILSQEAVRANYSGAAIVDAEGRLVIEGRSGEGDELMLGNLPPERLPVWVLRDVENVYVQLRDRLGEVRFEWVHDGSKTWVVQLHHGQTSSIATVLVPGDADRWITVEASNGLEALRTRLGELEPGVGVIISGEIGLTSHLADLARKSCRPTRIVPKSGG
jgi:hypothetical protein